MTPEEAAQHNRTAPHTAQARACPSCGRYITTPGNDMRIIRVFPRRTKATPTDVLAVVGEPRFFDEADEVHISVAFTWDLPEAERLAKAWRHVAQVKIGGPAVGTVGGAFTPGQYLRHGYTITSRGCPEKCWFCAAWKRDGAVTRPLPIHPGWNVLDDNLLACPMDHIRRVFDMLRQQPRRCEFTGGLHADRVTPEIVGLLSSLKPRPAIWLAYDEDRDLDPLRNACRLLQDAGWTQASHRLRCYVLCGWPGDTHEAAEARLRTALDCGCTPMAMVYRNPTGEEPEGWRKWARQWIRPAIIHSNARDEKTVDPAAATP